MVLIWSARETCEKVVPRMVKRESLELAFPLRELLLLLRVLVASMRARERLCVPCISIIASPSSSLQKQSSLQRDVLLVERLRFRPANLCGLFTSSVGVVVTAEGKRSQIGEEVRGARASSFGVTGGCRSLRLVCIEERSQEESDANLWRSRVTGLKVPRGLQGARARRVWRGGCHMKHYTAHVVSSREIHQDGRWGSPAEERGVRVCMKTHR